MAKDSFPDFLDRFEAQNLAAIQRDTYTSMVEIRLNVSLVLAALRREPAAPDPLLAAFAKMGKVLNDNTKAVPGCLRVIFEALLEIAIAEEDSICARPWLMKRLRNLVKNLIEAARGRPR